MMHKEETISATEVRSKFLELWGQCEFGVKERVKRVHSPRVIQYILETPTYSKADVILSVINTIEIQVELVKQEAIAMSESIKNIIR